MDNKITIGNRPKSFKKNLLATSLSIILGSLSASVYAAETLEDISAQVEANLINKGYSWVSGAMINNVDIYDGQKVYSNMVHNGLNTEETRGVVNGGTVYQGGYLTSSGSDTFGVNIEGGQFDVGLSEGVLGDGTVIYTYYGVANNTTVSGTDTSYGILDVDYGGSAYGTILNNRGWMKVNWELAYRQAAGRNLDTESSIAGDTIVNNGGFLSVYDGGIIDTTTVNDGGTAQIYDGGKSTGGLNVYKSGLVEMYTDTVYTAISHQSGESHAENITLHDSDSQLAVVANAGTIERTIGINNLINNGRMTFTTDTNGQGYAIANVKNLSGNGSISMRVAGMQGDFLNVTDSIDGSFNVTVMDDGSELRSGSEGYHLIHALGSTQQNFSLENGTVELGAYKYYLAQDQSNSDDWRLTQTKPLEIVTPTPMPAPESELEVNPPTNPNIDGNTGGGKPELSGSAKAVISMANVTPTVWDGELSTLRSRLGELRDQSSAQNGVWGKYITNRYRVSTDNVGYKQDMNGVMLGVDHAISQTGGRLVIGSQVSYSRSDLNYSGGGDGTVDSYSVGLYSTWLSDSGYYLDSVLKANRFKTENNAKFGGGRASASDNTNGIGLSVEGGKHIKLDSYFIEPYLMASAFRGGKTSYTLSNNLKTEADAAESMKAEIGTTFGKSFLLDNGSQVKPYARVAASHEFKKNNSVTINDTERFNNDMSGSVGKYGVGVSAQLGEQWSTFAEVNYAKGSSVEMPYSGNIGVRYSF
ncbi:autotransporter outer membrane beta-barrel domain-containing protein [Budvicia aquatica]|uniref:Adhesin/invasin TibA autotransporter n=1 Tax=Budvicia aquatica TaxID=82979 RepID=A0A2C6DK20_9GAMM|nr:autotransporter outer membrane beta-barrel domain-containing protein [Budvicia aquatica]PHI29104.1 autotransporter outer membrane beta-barrel domain-containing protein [Budvicia aquatica]VFS47266.1 Adhesin/invasin TibA autotransporter precursor [Budvicia aquatica]